MDIQVIDDLYNRAIQNGYQKSKEEFINLLQNDPEVFYDMYKYVKDNGYQKTDSDFANLIGVQLNEGQTFDDKRNEFEQKFIEDQKKKQLQSQKQSGTTELPSADSSLVLPKQQTLKKPNTFHPIFQRSLYEAREKEIKEQEQASVNPDPFKAVRFAEAPEYENQIVKTQEELKKWRNDYKDQVGGSPFFVTDEVEKTITNDLIDQEEEFVVPQLNYKFGDLGFKFEEAGATGDWMKVTAPNGDTIEISLDPFTSSKEGSQRDILKQFIISNSFLPSVKLKEIEKKFTEQPVKFRSDKEFDSYVSELNKKYSDFEKEGLSLVEEKKYLDYEYERLNKLTDEQKRDPKYSLEYEKWLDRQKKFESTLSDFLSKEATLKSEASKIEERVGEYVSVKEEQGTWYDALASSFAKGVGRFLSSSHQSVMQRISGVYDLIEKSSQGEDWYKYNQSDLIKAAEQEKIEIPKEIIKYSLADDKPKKYIDSKDFKSWFDSLDEDTREKLEDIVQDKAFKTFLYEGKDGESLVGYLRDLPSKATMAESMSQEYIDAIKRDSFIGGALLGVAESIPSFLGGGGKSRVLRLILQSEDFMYEEMEKNPNFKDVSETDKRLFASTVGVATAALEEFGFRNIINQKGLVNNLVLRALGKSGANTSAKTFRQLVRDEVESGLLRGTLIMVNGALAEAETGALQQVAETGLKEAFNEWKGKEMFKTPESWTEFAYDVGEAALSEAIGGFVLGTPSAVSAAYRSRGFEGMSDEQFLFFESAAKDENIQKSFVADLKKQVSDNVITMSRAKEIFMEYRNSVGLYRQMPENMSVADKKKSMNLLVEKKNLENYINNKDEALVKKQKDRIAEINSQLNTISENAIQEQATGEVSVQPTTEVSETVAEGKPESKPEVVTGEGIRQQALTPEEEERKVALTEALKTPNQEKGTVTVGKEIIPVETAQQELTTLEDKTKPPVVEEQKAKVTEEPASIKERIINELGVDVQVNEDGTFEEPVAVEETPDSKERIDNAIQQLTDAGYKPTSQVTPALDQTKQNEIKQQVLNDFNVVVDFNEDGTFQPPVLQEGVTEEGAETKIKDAVRLLTESGFTPSAQVSVTSKEEPVITLQEALDTDIKEVSGLRKVYSFLDNIDNKLSQELDPKNMNDITRVMPLTVLKGIVKAVKALVRGGIALQDAISRVAASNNLTDNDVVRVMGVVSNMEQGIAEGLNETELPGYDRMMTEVDSIVTESRRRRRTEREIASNVKNYITGSPVYERASDVQKEALVRSVNKKFGIREKSAPSVGRLFGTIKDVKKITMKEMDLLKKQLKDTAKGARDAVSAWKKASKELSNSLNSLKSEGKITSRQLVATMRRFSKVNLLDDVSISDFVEYTKKILESAAYAERMENIRSNVKAARSNMGSKVGSSVELRDMLNKLLSVDPSLVPDSVLDKYAEIVEMFGARKKVLELDEISSVKNDINNVLQEIDNQQSRIPELTERFNNYPNKVIKDGKLKYNETIDAMVESGDISTAEANLMKKNRKLISPVERAAGRTEQEIADEKNQLINSINATILSPSNLSSRFERDFVSRFIKLINSFDLSKLDNNDLNNLLRAINNINNGYLPHYAELIYEKMDGINDGDTIIESTEKAKPAALSLFFSKITSFFTRENPILDLIRSTHHFYIDQAFGDYNTKNLFNAIYNKLSKGQNAFKSEYDRIQQRLKSIETKISKSFPLLKGKLDPNALLFSKFKMMVYMMNQEYISNPGSDQVNPVREYINETIKQINQNNSKYGKREADMLQEILDEYVDVEIGQNADGSPIIDTEMEKLRLSFNQTEMDAMDEIRQINDSLTDKAVYTASVIRGESIDPLVNYVHLNTQVTPAPDAQVSSASSEYNNSRNPSTKAKSLIKRSGKVVPIDFDIIASVSQGSKGVLLDYHMTAPLRTARKAFAYARSKAGADGSFNDKQWNIFTQLENAFAEVNENVLSSLYTNDSFADEVVNYISRQGYRATLASIPRSFRELVSNITYAIWSPIEFAKGLSLFGMINSQYGVDIMINVKSSMTTRAYGKNLLKGSLVDPSILGEASGIQGGTAKSYMVNKLQQIHNLTTKKYMNTVGLIADALIATPDKMITRPIWFGTFAVNFEKITGQKPDFEKIAKNDESYINNNIDAINESTRLADQATVMSSTSDNPYMETLKGKRKPNDTALTSAWNIFNNYMTRFMINEYATSRTAINAAMGRGMMSRTEGARVLAAVTTRMVVYSVLVSYTTSAMFRMFGVQDDEEEKNEKGFLKKLGQAFVSAGTSLFFGRDFGNGVRTIVNFGLEKGNEKYLGFLRDGEYDPYKDFIQYGFLPDQRIVDKEDKIDMWYFIKNMSGPYAPILKTTDKALENIFVKSEKEKKKEERVLDEVLPSRKEKEKEKQKTPNQKYQEEELNKVLPLEIMGNFGLIPLYKDVRQIVKKGMSTRLQEAIREEAKKQEADPKNNIKKMTKEILDKYKFENRSDMKKYAPDLYKREFGPGSKIYEIEEPIRKLEREKDKLDREIKDKYYDYVPKGRGKGRGKKGSFGSSGFGESGGGFGSGGFGEGGGGFGSKGFGQ